ncbi:DUF721 domain-containing protein [Parvularcula oceani]|uniref:DUF721 domain-containing protein n=1 Tax=Parvularcula oceani TaxID=1247963 RepID=UPI000689983B|nr:DUF721 domain-containing protein [Parvularcula oceani]
MTQAPFPTKPARRGPPPLSAKLAPQVAQLAAKSGAMDPALARSWPEVVGPELAKLCRPLRLRRQKNAITLEVAVPNGAAAMRVQYAQNQILSRARTQLRQPKLSRLAILQAGAKASEGRSWASKRVTRDDGQPAPAPRPARTAQEALERLRAAIQARKG